MDLHVLRLSAHLCSLRHVFLDFVLLGDHIISETIAEIKVFLGVLLIIVTQCWLVGLGKLRAVEILELLVFIVVHQIWS